ncbi:MAG TPA: exodeoxyribonuclease III [Candidatus Paceibacterota bacterium]|jgi:exodeoxyribonuclease-3|nr:exodeoxyribonuclease III [Candidatus Paceibacterota bacterium]
MKIISWNVNGIRANIKKGGFEWMLGQNADIFCFQETKAHPEQLSPETVTPHGYVSYFDHSKGRKGYSGVAIYVKSTISVEKAEYGFGIQELDQEGRQMTLFFKADKAKGSRKWAFINTYFPNGGGGPERLAYKLRYYDAFLAYIEKIRKAGYSVIFTGDVNTAHTEIDLARPKENVENTGFLPIERAWIDKVIAARYVDIFRAAHPGKTGAYTYWDMKTFARERNVGWRIDYFFVSEDLVESVKKADILSDVLGSDHCPIFLNVAL